MTKPPLSSYDAEFPSDVRLSTGVLYIGDEVWGGTLGGIAFNPNKEVVNIDFDGKRVPVLGLDRTARRRPVLSGTAQKFGLSDIEFFEPGGSSDSGWSGGAAYIPARAGTLWEAGMYTSNVRCVWQRGNGEYVQVRFPKAIIQTWQSADNDPQAAGISFEIEARVDMSVGGATPSDAGYVIEYLESAS